MYLQKDKFSKQGDASLADKLEQEGYDWVLEQKQHNQSLILKIIS